MQRVSQRVVIVFLIVLVFSACSACNNGGGNGAKSPVPAQESCAPTSPAAPNVTGAGALIVTDVSGSMSGFVAPGSTRLYSVHDALERSLRNALGAVGAAAAIKRCELGKELQCENVHAKPDMDKPIYTAPESRLDLFFAANKKGQSATDSDLLGSHRIAILATDGMQAQAESGSSGKPCLNGADPECLAYLLKQRIAAGYGVWMVMLYLPYKGLHDGYRPLDDSHWQRIQKHFAGLAQDPYFQGVNFKLGERNRPVKFSAYGFQGVKPYLIMALSKDYGAGREFVKQFTETIRKESVAQPTSGIYAIELAPLAAQTLQITGVKQDRNSLNPAINLIKHERKKNYYDFLIDCERDGAATFWVEAKRTDDAQALTEGVAIEFTVANSGEGKLPAEALTIKNPLTPGKEPNTFRAELACNCKTIKPGEYERWFKLQANLKSDLNPSSPWAALQADNTYEAPERFYGLKDVIQRVLEPATKDPRISDCLHLRLTRK